MRKKVVRVVSSGQLKPVLEYEFTGEASPARREGFEYLSFQVPGDVCTIEVWYEFAGKSSGEAVVDIGLFEPGSRELLDGMKALRGWSGSNKRSFIVSRCYATPGYLPGDIKPGEWSVVLGFYKVPSAGLTYRVGVRVYRECRCEQSRQLEREPPLYREGWVRGDLHIHSVHSDGDSTLEEIALAARGAGLDFVAVTDHNTVSQIAEMGWRSGFFKGVFFLRGVEMTTYRGHMNVYGVCETPEFRVRSAAELGRVVKHLRSIGALLSVNHPKPLGPDWELGDMSFADTVEVFHSVWEFNNYVSLRRWDELLRKGFKIGIVGGSDAHEIKGGRSLLTPGAPTTWVFVEELSEENLLEAIRRQRVFVSESPSGPKLILKALANGREYWTGDTVGQSDFELLVRVEGAQGQTLRLIAGGEVVYHEHIDASLYERGLKLRVQAPYVRGEVLREVSDVEDPYHMENIISSLSNPIYVKHNV